MKAQLGIAPIAWWNDDLLELSDDVSLEECLRQASEVGFTGMETGRRFPLTMAELGAVLERYHMAVCGGWFSGQLIDTSVEQEKERIASQLQFFIDAGAPCLVYGETARSIQGTRPAKLVTKPQLTEAEMADYGGKVSDLADWCDAQGMPLAYHHHMGAVVETEAEVDLLMKHSSVSLLLDTGHLAFAGGEILRVIANHHHRIVHIHAKDVRRQVLNQVNRDQHSFLDAVVAGVFTVPGDGDMDFAAIVAALHEIGYEGWFVVEAEQDPVEHPPQEMARTGQAEMLRVLKAAGYEVG